MIAKVWGLGGVWKRYGCEVFETMGVLSGGLRQCCDLRILILFFSSSSLLFLHPFVGDADGVFIGDQFWGWDCKEGDVDGVGGDGREVRGAGGLAVGCGFARG